MQVLLAILAITLMTQGGTLHFTAPPAWKSRPAASAMRVAEFTVPRAAGDSEDGEVVVYFFGGAGGGVKENIERWVGQFQAADGGPASAPVEMVSKIGALTVTSVDVSGTYVAEIRPGQSERFNKPGFRMRAAVIETPKGPYFVKLTGPQATVNRALTSGGFSQFIRSLRFE